MAQLLFIVCFYKVVDQTLQLNRILRLLKDENYLSHYLKYMHLDSAKSSYRPQFNYHAYNTDLDDSVKQVKLALL